jgi:hypothetical protein
MLMNLDLIQLRDCVVGMPGAEILLKGLEELSAPSLTENALLVLIASPRLNYLGIPVVIPPGLGSEPPFEHQLFTLLESVHGSAAHSRYNALLSRMTSFVHTYSSSRLTSGLHQS